MPQKSKRRRQTATAIGRRWTTEIFVRLDNDSDEQTLMNSSHLSENDKQEFSLRDKISIEDIGDLFEVVKSQCSIRSLSTKTTNNLIRPKSTCRADLRRWGFDNARTLNAKEFPLEGFGMKPGTRYPINQIQYMDEHGKQKIVDCYFTGGANKGKPKGLLILAEELKIKVPANIKLEELKRLLSLHKAFQN
ncbi:unnamed protein product, partial [Rotaria sordida]